MTSNVRILSTQGPDRQTLTTFYLAHADGRLRHRVEQGSLSLDPRVAHTGVADAKGALAAVVQTLPAHRLDRADHWLAFFETHTVPGGANRLLLLLQPVTVPGGAGRQALTELLDDLAEQASSEDIDALLLGVPADQVTEAERLGFVVYANGRRGSGAGFMVPMARVVGAADDPQRAAMREWLAAARKRRAGFIVRDPTGPRVGGGLLQIFRRAV